VTVARPQSAIAEDLARYEFDPLGFVLYAYPWGQPGTYLEKLEGPEQWAADLMLEIQARLTRDPFEPIQMATASGKGITKSATAAQLVQWAMCTHQDTRGLITANTEMQLRTKTWPEFHKWYNLLICRHWFTLTDTVFQAADPQRRNTWRFDRVTWSEHNLEAAQGLHNQGRRIIAIFDEASKIAQAMWDATAGILTDRDTQVLWLVFGNYTRNIGAFHDCFTKYRHRWSPRQIDSRTCKVSNKREIAKWIEDHGEDSDKVRIWVRGMPPKAACTQLIPTDLIELGATREATSNVGDPLIFGLDVAREGDDDSVLRKRRGRDARFPALHWPKLTGPQLAERVALEVKIHEARGEKVHAIFIDCTGGYGWSVFDSLVALHYSPIPVKFADPSPRKGLRNKRIYMYHECLEWLLKDGAIENNEILIEDLKAQEYTVHEQSGDWILRPKDEIKAELGRSPDDSDALVLTFAEPVAGDGIPANLQQTQASVGRARADYNPMDAA
jgi:hypothetical protein